MKEREKLATLIHSGAVTMVGFFDNTRLFCGSQDHIYAVGPGNETVYCTLSGMAIIYYITKPITYTLMKCTPHTHTHTHTTHARAHTHMLTHVLAHTHAHTHTKCRSCFLLQY